MRFFYVILKTTLQYALRIFYPRIKTINSPKEYLGRTIYVSNHAASFMDPLIVATLRRPIVFFMTRSDVFTPITKPILWAAHMLPIYRQHDGVDTKDKNQEVFDKCTKILSFGRNLLIFGEGFTDDVFIRRLKPVKKGALRIGFNTLESLNWSKKIYIAAVGVNYSDPNEMRSDVLVATSQKICLNDFQKAYEENPNKVINELTKRIELLMQEQITHIEDKEWSNFHENVMKLTRKGMNARHSNKKIPLEQRWNYSRNLAHWLNQQDSEKLKDLLLLKNELEKYFALLRKLRVDENYVYEKSITGKIGRSSELLKLIILFPFAVLGILHCGLPYLLVKSFVEKSFKRKVFWGSVKLLLGMISMGLLNIPFIFLFKHFVYPSFLLGFLYYAMIGIFGLSAYIWFRNYRRFIEKGKVRKIDLAKILLRRTELLRDIEHRIPVA